MAQFVLKINLGNDAMRSNMDVGIALKQVGNEVMYEGRNNRDIRDRNGNTVGHYEVSE